MKALKRIWNLATLARRTPKVGLTPAEVVHAENKWKLLRYRPVTADRFDTPVLLVPSLINRHYVLDLQPGKSFAEYLVAHGHDVFVIDWGTPGPEDRWLDFDEITDRYLGRAIRKAARMSERRETHVLGYCLGGTLAAIHAAANPGAPIASLVALAAPVRFSDGGLLSSWMRSESFDVDAMIDAFGNVPWPLMQASFHLLRPTLTLSKAVGLLDRAWDDRFLDGFLAIERWGNDNVSFPGECFRRYAHDLYRGDAFAKGTFRLSGKPARMEAIEKPLLAITFEHDHIVPWKSAALLTERASSKDKDRWHLPGGHVGAVVSRHAAETLWPRLSGFWAERDRRHAAGRRAA